MFGDVVAAMIDALALCLRAAFGRNQHGNSDPDRPVNRGEIFSASLVFAAVAAGLAGLGSLVFSATWQTAAQIALAVLVAGSIAAALAADKLSS